MTETQSENSQEIAVNTPAVFDDLALARIKTFDDVFSAFQNANVQPEQIADYGTGFTVLDDKDRLIGVPFVAVQWRFNYSKEYADGNGEPLEFVTVTLMTKHSEKFLINDGGSGIYRQLKRVTALRMDDGHPTPQAGMFCADGLTVSRYPYTDPVTGKKSTAETFYLSEQREQ